MHGPKKKPSRGVCQVCGKPVVAVEKVTRGGCFGPQIYTNGHSYKENGKLESVLCADHFGGTIAVNRAELNRPPTPEELALAEKIRGTK